MDESQRICPCAYCSNNLDFELDEYLISEITSGNAVIFAGAGVSTENSTVAPHTLYDSIIEQIGEEERGVAFPDAVEKLTNKKDGRFQFLKLVQERFDYIEKFADLRYASQRFFHELSTIPCINEYVTTNWDRNFEEVCCAKPFSYDEDMRFWDLPRRKVLKIHGTIDNYSSLVASRSDYERAEQKLHVSLIGSALKSILSRKTCIFIGYSLQDDDFRAIFRFVEEAQGAFSKTHYFVNPRSHYNGEIRNIISIKTDGTFFLKAIKDHLGSSPCVLKDTMFEEVSNALSVIKQKHLELWEKFNPAHYPQTLASAFYQDGLIHGYRLILDESNTGRFSHSCEVVHMIKAYDKKISDMGRRRMYLQVAYFSGFQNALVSIASAAIDDRFVAVPAYFHNGVGVLEDDVFHTMLGQLPELHKGVYRQSVDAIQKLRGKELVLQVKPWLPTLPSMKVQPPINGLARKLSATKPNQRA